jgi:hypothetical protein
MRASVRALILFIGSVTFINLTSSAVGLQTIDDIRVDALVATHWGQKTDTGYSNTGSPCFNYYTPENTPCGCVAVPMAQLCWYWRYPESIPSDTSKCLLNDVELMLSYGGEVYNYDLMSPVTTGIDEIGREAIGRLTYDCAVSLHSMFSTSGTLAYGVFSFVQLREIFGYDSAVGYVPFKSTAPNSKLENTIIANLDAKCPVLIALFEEKTQKAHQALIDGYGYHNGKLYFHYNLGWCNVRGDDAWYELGKSVDHTTGNAYSLIDGIVYNIFPKGSGDILSGRILGVDGNPASGVEVQAIRNGIEIDVVKTDKNGIYAFKLPGNNTYKVSCEGRSISVFLPPSSCAGRKISSKNDGDIWENPFMPEYNEEGVLGGSSGNDIDLSVEVNPLGSFNPNKAGKGAYPYSGVVYDENDNPSGTITIKFTKPSKGTSKISAKIKLLNGKSYSLSSTKVQVNDDGPALITDKVIKKLGVLDSLEIGESGFVAKITMTDGKKLTALTTDLSKGLSEGKYTFSVDSIPTTINGLAVVKDMLLEHMTFSINAKGKISLPKAASLTYKKIKKSKPTAYELVLDTSKGKTNLMGLKLSYSPKTSSIKGSFVIYTDNPEKHKINKYTFTITGMVVEGKAVGIATCKKPSMTSQVFIEKNNL